MASPWAVAPQGVMPSGTPLYVPQAVTLATVGTVNDWNPSSGTPTSLQRIDVTVTGADATMTGMLAGYDGQQVWIRNLIGSTFNLVFPYANAGSAAANRWRGPAGSLSLLPGFRTVAIYYAFDTNPGWSIG